MTDNRLLTLSSNLEKTLCRAMALANAMQHEFATVEHLLMALTDDEDAASMLKCAVKIDRLRHYLNDYLDLKLSHLVVEDEDVVDVKPTGALRRVIKRAAIHVRGSERKEVTGADILVALLSERKSHAVFFLQESSLRPCRDAQELHG